MHKIKDYIYILYFCFLNFLANRQGILILMYHRINDSLSPSDLITSPVKFRKQMGYLKKYCDVISLREVCDIYINKKEIKHSRRPQVVITIDDGYHDNYLNAYPILKRLNLPATIFLVTGFIGTDKKMLYYENMPSHDMLSWEEVRAMKNGNIIFCPHTETHPHLPELVRLEQRMEVKNSMDSLKKNLSIGRDVQMFSYTYGEYNEDTLVVLRELGVKLAVTVKPGINTLNDDPLELKRLTADGRDSLVDFMRKLAPDPDVDMRSYKIISCLLKIVRRIKKIIIH